MALIIANDTVRAAIEAALRQAVEESQGQCCPWHTPLYGGDLDDRGRAAAEAVVDVIDAQADPAAYVAGLADPMGLIHGPAEWEQPHWRKKDRRGLTAVVRAIEATTVPVSRRVRDEEASAADHLRRRVAEMEIQERRAYQERRSAALHQLEALAAQHGVRVYYGYTETRDAYWDDGGRGIVAKNAVATWSGKPAVVEILQSVVRVQVDAGSSSQCHLVLRDEVALEDLEVAVALLTWPYHGAAGRHSPRRQRRRP